MTAVPLAIQTISVSGINIAETKGKAMVATIA